MVETIELSEEIIAGTSETGYYRFGRPIVLKTTLEGIDEIQYLHVGPRTSIKKHGHDNQWEVWVSIFHKTAYVCLKGEEHELVNNTDNKVMHIMAIKGHFYYSYDDLEVFFVDMGFSVTHGSLVLND